MLKENEGYKAAQKLQHLVKTETSVKIFLNTVSHNKDVTAKTFPTRYKVMGKINFED